MPIKKGDLVQLKIPEQGRLYRGTVDRITDENIKVNLPNGLYVIKPNNCWELVSEKGDTGNDSI